MYWARCPEFTINFGIPAMHAALAQIDIVFLTDIAGFPFGMIDAAGQ